MVIKTIKWPVKSTNVGNCWLRHLLNIVLIGEIFKITRIQPIKVNAINTSFRYKSVTD